MIRITSVTKPAYRAPASVWSQVCLVAVLVVLACVAGLVVHTWSQVAGHGRTCTVPWKVLGKEEAAKTRIAVVTISISGNDADAADSQHDLTVAPAGKEFQRLTKITQPNIRSYTVGQGYAFIDATDLINASRPASWSKVVAVLSALEQREWVLWADADVLVTDFDFPLHSLLPRNAKGPDLILARDTQSAGYAAGVWLVRNSEWSKGFLQRWWDLDAFVHHGGHAGSPGGETQALQHLLSSMKRKEFQRRVGVTPQCAFNSYLWVPSWRNWRHLLAHPLAAITGMWQPGDFMVHLDGVDDKVEALHAFFRRHGADRFLPQATRTVVDDASAAPRGASQSQRVSHGEEARPQVVAPVAKRKSGRSTMPEPAAVAGGTTRKKAARKGGGKRKHGGRSRGSDENGHEGQPRADRVFQKRKQRPKVTGRTRSGDT